MSQGKPTKKGESMTQGNFPVSEDIQQSHPEFDVLNTVALYAFHRRVGVGAGGIAHEE